AFSFSSAFIGRPCTGSLRMPPVHPKDSTVGRKLLYRGSSVRPMSARGHDRSFGDVGSMSGLPKSGHDWAMSTRPSLTPLADLGRSARQAPLHGLHAAGIAAARHDAEVAARLFERL